jgi:uncharacterized membrane protein YfhO
VNGTGAPILRADAAFRAVAVPAGTSTIEMRYRAPGLSTGLAISGFSLIGIAALFLVSPLKRRRSSAEPSASPEAV